jgi:hypothetical protein
MYLEILESYSGRGRVSPEGLSLAQEGNLDGDGGHDGLGMDQRGVAQVVQASLGQQLGAGLEPQGLSELHSCELGQQLRGQAAQSSQHGPAGVDDLGLAVAAATAHPPLGHKTRETFQDTTQCIPQDSRIAENIFSRAQSVLCPQMTSHIYKHERHTHLRLPST